MSVTDKEMKKVFAFSETPERNFAFNVNDAEMVQFANQDKRLAKKIATIKLKFDVEYCGGKSNLGYEKLEELCQIPIDTMKKTIRNEKAEARSKIRPTRNFVYKLVVGLKMPVEQANELFALCGGSLTEECAADYICLRALEHGDDIFLFLEQYKKYIGKSIGIDDN